MKLLYGTGNPAKLASTLAVARFFTEAFRDFGETAGEAALLI